MSYTLEQLRMPGLTIHAKKVSWAIAERIRGLKGFGNPLDVVYIAYLFYKLLNSGDNKLKSPYSLEETARLQWERFRTGEIKLNPYILNSVDVKNFISAYKIYEDVGDNDDIYAAIIAFFDSYLNLVSGRMDGEYSTSDSLVKLTQALLDIKNDERVADICCGYGKFIMNSIAVKPEAQYFAYEVNINCAAIIAMRADILGVNPDITMGDVEYTLSNNPVKFDKIFSNYPLGLRLDNYEEIIHRMPFWIGRSSSDWYFNNIVMEHLADGGKAIAIAGVGSTWNVASKEARKYFVENGYIEAVINLPGGLMSSTLIPLTLYVFSHGNKKIRLVNAEDIITVKDRYNKLLSDDDIAKILAFLRNDSEKSILITKEDAEKNDYSLAFRTYRSGLPKYENGISLSDVADIIRGTVNPRKSTTTIDTGKYLLQISDLESGVIKKDLGEDSFIEGGEELFNQKLLPYDLIISRSAQPVKIAIVPPNEKRELYPNGNMFVIRVKSANVNPYYLLSFLLSRDGQEALDFASTGNALKTISVSSLADLVFPLKTASEQREVGETIIESISQYEAYSLRANIAKNRIVNSFYGEES